MRAGSVTQDSGESLGKNKRREDGKKKESRACEKGKREKELAPIPHMLAAPYVGEYAALCYSAGKSGFGDDGKNGRMARLGKRENRGCH